MEMRNCPKCKRLFHYSNVPICPDCVKEDERIFEEVRQYIRQNPESPLAVVSEATGCSIKKIMRYVREGRIEITKGISGEIVCEYCGKPITKGRYCDACVIELNHTVSEMFDKKDDSTKLQPKPADTKGKPRMHTALN